MKTNNRVSNFFSTTKNSILHDPMIVGIALGIFGIAAFLAMILFEARGWLFWSLWIVEVMCALSAWYLIRLGILEIEP